MLWMHNGGEIGENHSDDTLSQPTFVLGHGAPRIRMKNGRYGRAVFWMVNYTSEVAVPNLTAVPLRGEGVGEGMRERRSVLFVGSNGRHGIIYNDPAMLTDF